MMIMKNSLKLWSLLQWQPIAEPKDAGRSIRLALALCMITMLFELQGEEIRRIIEKFADGQIVTNFEITMPLLVSVIYTTSAILTVIKQYSRVGIALFSISTIALVFPILPGLANHTYLALWTIVVAMFIPTWFSSTKYARYLAVTLGMVMVAAFLQKILAGTYVDGTYLGFLIFESSKQSSKFMTFLCSDEANQSCASIIIFSNFILIWQLAVGLMLILGVKGLLFLIIEVGFLLGAGVFADEMNFQILNIGLLAIAFQIGISRWFFVVGVGIVLMDLWGIPATLSSLGLGFLTQ